MFVLAELPVPSLPVTDPVLVVAITMGILLVGPLLFERFRVPGLVGLIALGAVAGPSVTGLLERDATFVLLGTFGLLYLMFVAGVTLDLGEFARQRTTAVAFGGLSYALPAVLALGAGRLLLGMDWPAAILLGSIVGSHTLLALPLAQQLGIAGNRAVVVATGATLVTDLLSLVALAVVQGVAAGDAGAGFWLRFAGLSAAWAALVLAGLPRLAAAFFRRVRREDDLAFAFLLACVFASAWLASLVGLAPIIGAFLAGIALNRAVPKASPLLTRLLFVGDAFLIPFFLVSVGLLVDVRVMGSAEVWMLAGVFTALVVVGKGGAALLGVPLFGFTRAEGATLAGLTIPQAAATLAVTLIGFDLGLFSQTAVNAVVLLIVVSVVLGPSLVRAFGGRVAQADLDAPGAAPAPERILVPLANPETAEELMELALLLRRRGSEEPVFPMSVARSGPDAAQHVAAAERLMARAVQHATAASVPCTPAVRIDDDPAGGLLRGAREVRASEIVIGWTGHPPPGAALFGGVIDALLSGSRAAVVVARLVRPLAAARRLVALVPPQLHREAGFARALGALKGLAAQGGLEVVLLAAADDAAAVEAAARAVRPEARLAVQPVAAWGHVVRHLDGVARPGDVLVLLSVRAGSVAWRPALSRLPRVLARRFADADLLTVYLSEADVERYVAEALAPDADAPPLHLPPEHVGLDLRPGPPERLLADLLRVAHPERADALARQLADGRGGEAPEVAPGVVLFHATAPDIPEPALFLGVCPGGADVFETSGPAQVLVALLLPEGLPPGEAQRCLAVAAKLVRDDATVAMLLDAAEPADAARLARTSLREVLEPAA